MLAKQKCCCGLLDKTKTLCYSARVIVVSDIALLGFILTGYLAWFSLLANGKTWYLNYFEAWLM